MVSHIDWTWAAAGADWGPNIAATPLRSKWHTVESEEQFDPGPLFKILGMVCYLR